MISVSIAIDSDIKMYRYGTWSNEKKKKVFLYLNKSANNAILVKSKKSVTYIFRDMEEGTRLSS